MDVKWKSQGEGYWESQCGRFSIEPLYFGRTTAQSYRLRDNNTAKKYSRDKIRECKELAYSLANAKPERD